MQLSYLLKDVFYIPSDLDREIGNLSLHSNSVQPQTLFIALKGSKHDGRAFISDAISQGASAILVNESDTKLSVERNVLIIPIDRLQSQVGKLAARFYDFPANKLRIFGVTGTSGKTSCTHFIAELLQALRIPCGLIGSLGRGFYNQLEDFGLTTPDAITLQATLNHLYQSGAKAIAMEVSSHGIDQKRIDEVNFEMGIFTNLSQDHLDYHQTMENYAGVKRQFFAEYPHQHLILNADDSYGQKWIKEFSNHKSVLGYATEKSPLASIYATKIEYSLQGIKAYVHSPWGKGDLFLPLIGEFNLSNALAVVSALCLYGISFDEVLQHFAMVNPVPGRLQIVSDTHQPYVIVDHAHKPDALEKVLRTLRHLIKGKLVCVFGCGGERDPTKRPLMASIAERWADQIIVTNDNPRGEKPEDIVHQIMKGFSHPERVALILDRSQAIENSIQWAGKQDCVLIAGKGAEKYQQIGDEKIPFDDVVEVKLALKGTSRN